MGLCVLVETVLMETVPGLIELRASVMMLVGSVSRTEVEVSICVGKAVVILVELKGVVAISVVEVKTDNGMVGVEVTLLFGSISIHGVVGEVDTIVTDIDSGHGVVEEIRTVGVVSIEEVILGIEEEMMVLKGVFIAVVDVFIVEREGVKETLEELCSVVRVGLVAVLVVKVLAVSVVKAVGKLAVYNVAEVKVSL